MPFHLPRVSPSSDLSCLLAIIPQLGTDLLPGCVLTSVLCVARVWVHKGSLEQSHFFFANSKHLYPGLVAHQICQLIAVVVKLARTLWQALMRCLECINLIITMNKFCDYGAHPSLPFCQAYFIHDFILLSQ